METLWLGLLGSFLLLTAWIVEVWRLHKVNNVDAMAIKFLMLYIISNGMLLIHALNIKDPAYIILQAALVVFTLIEIDIVLRKRDKNKSRNKRATRKRAGRS